MIIKRFASQFAGVRDAAKYIPRRSLLYVPASNQKMLDKIPQMISDSVVLELEDGVALTAKADARKNATQALNKLPFHTLSCQELGLRVNSVSSGLLEDDIKEVSKAEKLPQAFMVPKVDSPEDLASIYSIFKQYYGEDRITNTSTRFVIWIESARALLDMPRIVSSALNLHRQSGFFKLDAVVFGSDDYCADIGATRTSHGTETLFARQKFVAVCKAFQLQAIDSVYIDIKDLGGLKRQCDEGRLWGFTGKQVIHPSQVPTVHEQFLPPTDRIQWAQELVHAYSEHESLGKGAFQFRGQMIDRPLLLQALNIIQLVERVTAPNQGSLAIETELPKLDIDELIIKVLSVGKPEKSLTRTIKEQDLIALCTLARTIFLQQSVFIEVTAPIKICGDVHGQYSDVLRLFSITGFPPQHNYLFLGDYVDRGHQNIEVITLFFCYKIKYPENFFLLRGNHECPSINRVYGFFEECNRRYSSTRLWLAFQETFSAMPFSGLVSERILCMHGGLSPKLTSLSMLRDLSRTMDPPSPSLHLDLLWSDPDNTISGWAPNLRGVSYVFGPSIVNKMCEQLDIDLIARAHQVVQDGYEFFAQKKLVTIFSAPHYCGQFDNSAAVMSVDENLMCTFQILRSVIRKPKSAL
ncbi:unnamed protein product [Caenorhabditis angaria]|uniref:Serine/threonine-protein phosphatase n=1 Tax=Caenorhabditis angaria TaxID=860376 RepID=A0A9P1IX06_9PELO|nr:unnamed protein product [Caenorhabditis angaria]